MPHITVKLYPGRTEQQKARLSEQIVRNAVSILETDEDSVSVAFEDVNPSAWPEVYRSEILNNPKLYKRPGYSLPA